jgi:rod shape-determining protein MreD
MRRRLVALGFATVILQVVVGSQVRLFGATADLVVLVVAAVGLLCGPVTGAGFGFALGLFVDLALVQTVGLSSLLYVAIGYGVGRLRELRVEGAFTAIVVGAVATLAGGVAYSLMQFLIGVDAPVSLELLREIISTSLVNAIVATPVFLLVRRALAAGLPDDRRRRRRPRRPAGAAPLSPLSTAR